MAIQYLRVQVLLFASALRNHTMMMTDGQYNISVISHKLFIPQQIEHTQCTKNMWT